MEGKEGFFKIEISLGISKENSVATSNMLNVKIAPLT